MSDGVLNFIDKFKLLSEFTIYQINDITKLEINKRDN